MQPFAPRALAAPLGSPEGGGGVRGGRGRGCRGLAISPLQKAISLSASGSDQPWSLVSSKIDAQTARSA